LLKSQPDKIKWNALSFNPEAIHLIEQNLDKINWTFLSTNPKAIHILEKHIDKISWCNLSENPNIFEVNKIQYKIDITEKANILDIILYKN
jgi:hypothetical protein